MAGIGGGGFAGGLASGLGLDNVRQTAIDLAHMKMQQQMNQFQMDKFNEQDAVKPIDEMINKLPYAGEELLPLRNEARLRAKIPGYAEKMTYQPNARVGNETVPQAIPQDDTSSEIDPNVLRNMLESSDERTPPAEMPTLTGDQAWNAKLTDAGRSARQADLERQINVTGQAIRKAMALKDYDWTERLKNGPTLAGLQAGARNAENLKTAQDLAYERGMGSGRARLANMPDEFRLKLGFLGDSQDARNESNLKYAGPMAAARAAGGGHAVVPGGVQIPPRGPVATVPNTQPGETMRTPNADQGKQIAAMDQAVEQARALAEEMAKPGGIPEGPFGLGQGGRFNKFWTQEASTDPTGIMKLVDPNATKRATFYQSLGQNQLANLRSIFGARITNMDMIFGKDIEPNAIDDAETLKWKTNQMYSRAVATSALLRGSLQNMGVYTGPDGRVTIPRELIDGLVHGSRGPAGNFVAPGRTPQPINPNPAPQLTPEDLEQYRRR